MRLPALALLFTAAAASAGQRPTRLAVPPIAALEAGSRKAADGYTQVLRAELTRRGVVVLTDTDPKDADYVLTGTAAQIGDQIGVELKLIDAAKGTVLATDAQVADRTEALSETARKSLDRVLAPMPATIEV